MGNRLVRMGIDVGGTHTKAVAIDNATHEIIGKSSVKTTHDDRYGVAAGVVKAFQNCLRENDIAPEDVIFVAHSTTQATNALIEGDVACVGVLGMGPGGMEGFLAKHQTRLKDIDLGSGRSIKIKNRYLSDSEEDENTVRKAVEELKAEGAQVLVASDAYGVDDIAGEQFVFEIAHDEMGMETTVASDITKLYGLTRRTRTAAINASILPKMLNTANSTEESVRKAGVEVPLMIMRGDGGVMEIVAYNRENGCAYAVNGKSGKLAVIPMSELKNTGVVSALPGTTFDIRSAVEAMSVGFAYGDMTSVAVSPDGKTLAAALQAEGYADPGRVALFSCGKDGSLTLDKVVTVGVQPDMVTFADQNTVLTADEVFIIKPHRH